MKNLCNVSELKNYKEVLSKVTTGVPVFLEDKNEVRYIILTIDDFSRLHTETYFGENQANTQ